MEQAPVLGNEEKKQPIDSPQQLAVILLLVKLARLKLLAEPVVAGVAEETGPQGLDRPGDPGAEIRKHAGALFAGKLAPLLQPCFLRLFGLQAGLVAEHPEQGEVGVDLTFHHGFQVELDIGLAGERYIVAEDAEHKAVGKKSPEAFLPAVEVLLHRGVGAGRGRTASALGAAVQGEIAAD